MLVDGPLLLIPLRARQLLFGLRPAMNEAVSGRLLLGLSPLGLFARSAQIDDGSHVFFSLALPPIVHP